MYLTVAIYRISPWANVPIQDQPERWDKPVLLVIPVAPADVNATLGPWLARHVTTKRNMVRFLLPKAGLPCIYDDADLRRISRCANLAKAWKDNEPVYLDIFKRFDKEMRRELSDRFDRFSLLRRWNYQQPTTCVFATESCVTSADKMAKTVEDNVRVHFFAPEDFEPAIMVAAQRIGEVPSDCMYVGDRINKDILPALGVGMQAVLKAAYTNAGKPLPAGTWKIERLAELPGLIDRINAEASCPA